MDSKVQNVDDMEAIILAGGLGTRLRSVVSDVPKCMAPVNGIPFIHFIVWYLKRQGINRFIFSLGYKHEIIIDYLDKTFPGINKTYSIETEPLGTGGAIKKACSLVNGKMPVILNGDTVFNIDISKVITSHQENAAACTIALKEMKQFSRYGSVEINNNKRITAFKEKRYCERGLINGGIYVLEKSIFLRKEFPDRFSFEQDYLEKYLFTDEIMGEQNNSYFIDIGIPEDYQKFSNDYNLILSREPQNNSGKLDSLLDSFFDGIETLSD